MFTQNNRLNSDLCTAEKHGIMRFVMGFGLGFACGAIFSILTPKRFQLLGGVAALRVLPEWIWENSQVYKPRSMADLGFMVTTLQDPQDPLQSHQKLLVLFSPVEPTSQLFDGVSH